MEHLNRSEQYTVKEFLRTPEKIVKGWSKVFFKDKGNTLTFTLKMSTLTSLNELMTSIGKDDKWYNEAMMLSNPRKAKVMFSKAYRKGLELFQKADMLSEKGGKYVFKHDSSNLKLRLDCEAPYSFLQALVLIDGDLDVRGDSLMPDKNAERIFKSLGQPHMRNRPVPINYIEYDTGDKTEVDYYIADGGFSICENDEISADLVRSNEVLFSRCLARAKYLLTDNGVAIIKVITVGTPYFHNMVNKAARVFKEVRLVKPAFSSNLSFEFYLILSNGAAVKREWYSYFSEQQKDKREGVYNVAVGEFINDVAEKILNMKKIHYMPRVVRTIRDMITWAAEETDSHLIPSGIKK